MIKYFNWKSYTENETQLFCTWSYCLTRLSPWPQRRTLASLIFWKIKVSSLLSLSLLTLHSLHTTTRHFYVYVPSLRSPLSFSEMRRTPSYRRRSLTSDPRSTPDRIPYSPSSSYSDPSTGQKSSSGRSVVAVAARSVAGAFVSCFTPPEIKSSVSFAGSEEFRAPSGNSISVTFSFKNLSWVW